MDGPYVLYAGKLATNKGVQYLLPAVARAGVDLAARRSSAMVRCAQRSRRKRATRRLNVRMLGLAADVTRSGRGCGTRAAGVSVVRTRVAQPRADRSARRSACRSPRWTRAARATSSQPRVTGLLSTTPKRFARDLAELAADERLRHALGAAARATCTRGSPRRRSSSASSRSIAVCWCREPPDDADEAAVASPSSPARSCRFTASAASNARCTISSASRRARRRRHAHRAAAAEVQRPTTADPFASPHIRLRHVPLPHVPVREPARHHDPRSQHGVSAVRLARGPARAAASRARARSIVVHGFGASVLGAADGMTAAPLVLNPQGLEEFGATAGALPPLQARGLRAAALGGPAHRARARTRIIATDVALEPTVVRHLRRAPARCARSRTASIWSTRARSPDRPMAPDRQRHGIGPGEIVLLSVGRLEVNKGFDVLRRRARARGAPGSTLAATGWRWVIVGAGPFARRSSGGRRARSRTARDLRGPRDRARPARVVRSRVVFVHPTRYEGSSLVTLEAMAHRRPVIATVAGGLPDKVRPGVNGWLVEPDDTDALSRAIAEAASHPTRLVAWAPEAASSSNASLRGPCWWSDT